jgi:aldose 1-epimerase
VRSVARLYEPGSGRELTVLTDQRGLQFYSGHMLAGTHAQRSGLCLEASAFPNQVNMPDAEAVMLRYRLYLFCCHWNLLCLMRFIRALLTRTL